MRPLVAHVVGARPNYMKVAPLYAELERLGDVEQCLIHTGQHYDGLLKDVFFAELPLPRPHIELQVPGRTGSRRPVRWWGSRRRFSRTRSGPRRGAG